MNKLATIMLYVTSAISLYIIGLLIGYLTPALSVSQPEVELYQKYNHIRIYEDGSFIGQTRAGMQVTGCITNAQCNNE